MNRDLRENYRQVFDTKLGFGVRPALVIIDFMLAYTDPASPLFAPDVVVAARATAPLLDAARSRKIPVIHTRVEYSESAIEGGVFVRKIPALRKLVAGSEWGRIVSDVAPRDGEWVLVKQYASAFFGTPLASALTAQRVDTLVIAGCSTSGCVRATAVDGIQHGFRVIVPRECVGDRAREPHEANLFDIDSKYGDVVSVQETLQAFSEFQP